MKIFSSKVEDLQARRIDNLKKALDLERRISNNSDTPADKAIDPQLAAEFRRHLKQTEEYISQLENLLHHSADEAA